MCSGACIQSLLSEICSNRPISLSHCAGVSFQRGIYPELVFLYMSPQRGIYLKLAFRNMFFPAGAPYRACFPEHYYQNGSIQSLLYESCLPSGNYHTEHAFLYIVLRMEVYTACSTNHFSSSAASIQSLLSEILSCNSIFSACYTNHSFPNGSLQRFLRMEESTALSSCLRVFQKASTVRCLRWREIVRRAATALCCRRHEELKCFHVLTRRASSVSFYSERNDS